MKLIYLRGSDDPGDLLLTYKEQLKRQARRHYEAAVTDGKAARELRELHDPVLNVRVLEYEFSEKINNEIAEMIMEMHGKVRD